VAGLSRHGDAERADEQSSQREGGTLVVPIRGKPHFPRWGEVQPTSPAKGEVGDTGGNPLPPLGGSTHHFPHRGEVGDTFPALAGKVVNTHHKLTGRTQHIHTAHANTHIHTHGTLTTQHEHTCRYDQRRSAADAPVAPSGLRGAASAGMACLRAARRAGGPPTLARVNTTHNATHAQTRTHAQTQQ